MVNGKKEEKPVAKTITEAQKNEKIAALLTRREALERELKNTEQSHKLSLIHI